MSYQRDGQRNTDTMRRSAPRQQRPHHARPHGEPVQHFAPDYGEARGVDADQRAQGVKDIVGGLVLIGIGLAFGGSVFLGTADAIDWIFDGLGTFWVVKGIYLMVTA